SVNCWKRPLPARWTNTPALRPATQMFPSSSAEAPITALERTPPVAKRHPAPSETICTSLTLHGPASTPPSIPASIPPSIPPSPASGAPLSVPASVPPSCCESCCGVTSFDLPLLRPHATATAIAATAAATTHQRRQPERMPIPPQPFNGAGAMPAGAPREPNQVGNPILTGGYQVWTSQKRRSQAELSRPGSQGDEQDGGIGAEPDPFMIERGHATRAGG